MLMVKELIAVVEVVKLGSFKWFGRMERWQETRIYVWSGCCGYEMASNKMGGQC